MARQKKDTAPVNDTAPAEAAPTAAPVALKVQGILFPFTPRYAAGHVLSLEESQVLNQTLGENLRNNFAARIRAKQEEIAKATPEGQAPREFTQEELDAFQADFLTYQDSYTFKGPRQGAGPIDPVLREATKMAKAMVLAALSQRSIDPKSLADGKMEALVQRVLDTKPEVMEEAKRRVASIRNVGSDILGDIAE